VASTVTRYSALHAPAHLDAEVLSALGRLHRAGFIGTRHVTARLEQLVDAPIERHALAALVLRAWQRRDRMRLMDALYVELARSLSVDLVTTDTRLAAAAGVAPIVS